MEKSDYSQGSLPVSQELCRDVFHHIQFNRHDLLNDAELSKYLLSDSELCKMEDYESNQMAPVKNLSTVAEDEYLAENVTTPQPVNVSNIPPCTDWPGDYDFSISFQPQEKATKSTSWIYSEIKEKIYVNMAVPCPINFHVKTSPPPGSVIRAMPIFSRSEHITDVVKRCLNHSNPTDALNEGHSAPSHLIRCDNSLSQYMEDIVTKRQSVIAPYENPQAGMEYTPYHYRFMCLGSCVGGLNRRPLKVIFTLEKDSVVLGRKAIDLRICACPGRDKKMDEKQFETQQRSSSHQTCNHDVISGPPSKKRKEDSGDEESHFTITVYRRSHYELLKKIKDALEIANLLPPEQLAMLRRRRSNKAASSVGTKLSASTQNSSNSNNSASVERWLYSIGMIAYVDCFKRYGYTCMEQLNTFTEEDLEKMRIGSRHKSKILKALLKYQKKYSMQLKYP